MQFVWERSHSTYERTNVILYVLLYDLRKKEDTSMLVYTIGPNKKRINFMLRSTGKLSAFVVILKFYISTLHFID